MFLTIIINIAILYQSQYYISSTRVLRLFRLITDVCTSRQNRICIEHNTDTTTIINNFILKTWLILHARDPGKYERRGRPNSIGLGAEWTWRQCWIRRGASSASALQFENITYLWMNLWMTLCSMPRETDLYGRIPYLKWSYRRWREERCVNCYLNTAGWRGTYSSSVERVLASHTTGVIKNIENDTNVLLIPHCSSKQLIVCIIRLSGCVDCTMSHHWILLHANHSLL